MTRVSKKKKEAFHRIYKEYEDKLNYFEKKNNAPMCEIYKHKLKAMRTTLSMLEIHIKGINQH